MLWWDYLYTTKPHIHKLSYTVYYRQVKTLVINSVVIGILRGGTVKEGGGAQWGLHPLYILYIVCYVPDAVSCSHWTFNWPIQSLVWAIPLSSSSSCSLTVSPSGRIGIEVGLICSLSSLIIGQEVIRGVFLRALVQGRGTGYFEPQGGCSESNNKGEIINKRGC